MYSVTSFLCLNFFWNWLLFRTYKNFRFYFWFVILGCLEYLTIELLMFNRILFKFKEYFINYLSVWSFQGTFWTASLFSGDGEIRTHDPLLARQVLSQLSYAPIMGLSGLEPPTSRLSGVRSNRLSYKPILIWQPPAFPCRLQHSIIGRLSLNHRVRDVDGCFP